MKEAVKRIVRDEKGHGIDLVLILLGVGAFIFNPSGLRQITGGTGLPAHC